MSSVLPYNNLRGRRQKAKGKGEFRHASESVVCGLAPKFPSPSHSDACHAGWPYKGLFN